MKKVILIVIVLLTSFTAFTETEVELSYYQNFGTNKHIETKYSEFYESLFTAYFYFDKKFENFTFGSLIKTFMVKEDKEWTFYPVSFDYKVFLEYEVLDDVIVGAEYEYKDSNNINDTKGLTSKRVYTKIKF